MKIEFLLNNKKISLNTDPMRRLLDVLRDDLAQLSVKESCGEGECGACSVLLNDLPVTSCLINVIQADGGSVMTAEFLEQTALGKLISQCFQETNAVQCGFCFPGFLVAAYHFLSKNPSDDDQKIRQALSGNICRCTGYKKIIDAVKMAADILLREAQNEFL